jgi:hypothetical protein
MVETVVEITDSGSLISGVISLAPIGAVRGYSSVG